VTIVFVSLSTIGEKCYSLFDDTGNGLRYNNNANPVGNLSTSLFYLVSPIGLQDVRNLRRNYEDKNNLILSSLKVNNNVSSRRCTRCDSVKAVINDVMNACTRIKPILNYHERKSRWFNRMFANQS